ncbi:glycosyltransferase family 2 protein [Halorientalis halophila]|uniref:glycosyltransferase family 2 protein n=1 Tax=Halorientalis halophila TaxID=3108499 RepID=UPI00300B1318
MVSVSVVIPTLGRTERLRRAIESVTAQTVLPDSMIVVDGSDDGAAKPLVSDQNLPFDCTYTLQDGDGGPSEARNIGIEATDAELVAFLDDDDHWHPKKLETQLDAYDRLGAGLIFCGIENVRLDGTVTNRSCPTAAPDAKSILVNDGIGSPSAVLVRREDAEAVGGFDEAFPVREDWEFYVRLLQVTEAAAVPEPLVTKEYNPEGLSRNVELAERYIMKIHEKHREKYDAELTRKFKRNNHFILGRRYAKAGKTAQARSHFSTSLSNGFQVKTALYLFASCLGPWGYESIRKISRRLRVGQSA